MAYRQFLEVDKKEREADAYPDTCLRPLLPESMRTEDPDGEERCSLPIIPTMCLLIQDGQENLQNSPQHFQAPCRLHVSLEFFASVL